MTTKEKFEILKDQDIHAKSDKARTILNADFERLAQEDPEGFEEAVITSMRRTLYDAKKLKVKEQMSEITEIVSMSYIAKTYFNKTKSWLSQRINELNVNGKPAQFTPEEIETLNAAFEDISKKIATFHISR
ncbi:DUF5053 domain-containing protein [Paludibacter sp. 221]|uniref:DUF5053 domain-containing protein n=1 Tax=Paludibacter sp. 221 TaxID=2302939 RepID=UPI0013D1C253|nr:DUF5053 domain-containing protein [Paludibacter sp. 221]NDV45852.1 DUF5053 domain-containing protein [Paludibacter sp. 221]